VHTSLLEGMLSKLDFQGARYTMNKDVPGKQGNFHPVQVPMGTYPAKDGLVNVAASTGKMWRNFCEALDANDLLTDPAYADGRSRARNRARLNAAVGEVTRRFTTAELVERLNPVGVPCGPIYTVGEAFEDPQVRHLKMTRTAPHEDLGDIALVRTPINMSRFPQDENFHHAGPDPGQHTAEVLREFGIAADEIERLKQSGAIA
jgi:crotonobetainyl-CoA:carnitine CoA-transferase CaiB-like acyl-CoA transferase